MGMMNKFHSCSCLGMSSVPESQDYPDRTEQLTRHYSRISCLNAFAFAGPCNRSCYVSTPCNLGRINNAVSRNPKALQCMKRFCWDLASSTITRMLRSQPLSKRLEFPRTWISFRHVYSCRLSKNVHRAGRKDGSWKWFTAQDK